MNRQGLSPREIERARRTHGENRFSAQKRPGFLRQFIKGFGDPMILILLVALLLNVLFVAQNGDWFETIGIGSAVFLSVFVSTLSEHKSEKAFEKLRDEAGNLVCRVRRSGTVRCIPSGDLVVGDVVLLNAGDTVPADGYVLCGEIGVDQSALNGESREVSKHPDADSKTLGDPGLLFSGTAVAQGYAEMRVSAVGDATLYGKLAGQLQENGRRSPLKEKLSRLAKTLSKIGYCAAALVAGSDLIYTVFAAGGGNLLAGIRYYQAAPELFFPILLHALTLAVTVVVVSVPEGLPMMITVVLSSQMRRMLKEGVLLRKLSGIETAGNMDLLFCDKTGTLTEGRHAVHAIYSFDGQRLTEMSPGVQTLAAHFRFNNQALPENGSPTGSNATDRALLAYAMEHLPAPEQTPQVHHIPFDSRRKYSAAVLSDGRILLKGAPETLLSLCTSLSCKGATLPLSAARKEQLTRELTRLEESGERMIAFAQGQGSCLEDAQTNAKLVFFAALSDTLRAETRETAEQLMGAGVQIVMLTGDSKASALCMAREAGLMRTNSVVLSSDELSRMSDDEVRAVLPRLAVIYRCTPTDKSRLSCIASSSGRVTGMTGDGVNDAPALKLSDVGFSLGSGTQIAKDASDIVITDDRLSSLGRAVLYGRTVTRSIRKFITFQLTMNFCAVLISFLGPLYGIDSPITVLQMLWINLIMDTLASLAFAGEPPRESYMSEAPMRRDEPIITRGVLAQILFGTLFSLSVCCFFLSSSTLRDLYGYSVSETPFLTAFFLLFVFLGAFNLFNVRTPRLKLWAELSKNSGFVLIFLLIVGVQILLSFFGSTLFRCAPLPLPLLSLPILLALLILPADLLRKNIFRKRA